MKKIDAHIHVCEYINGFGAKGELIPIGDGLVSYANGKVFRIIPKGMGDVNFSIEKALEILDKYEIEKAVILQGNYLGYQNLYAYKAMKENNRFISACTFDPFCKDKDSIAKHLLNDLGFKIIKLECSTGSGFMANHDFSLDCKEMRYIYDLALKYHLVVVIDIGKPGSASYQIDTLVKIIKEYKDVTFVICHLLAFQIDQLELLETILPKFKLPNVYFDLASLINNTKEKYPYLQASNYVKRAISILGSNKLMWGTDMPSGLINNTYLDNINFIMNLNINDIDKENIFYNVANKVYFNS